MRRVLHFGSKSIGYQLEFKERKTLRISVYTDLHVNVIAPNGAQPNKINALLIKRAPWILKQQGFFLAFFPKQPHRHFISGETHLYLGKHYRLKIYRGKKESVHLSGRFIHVITSDNNRVKSLLKKWYRDRAAVRFSLYADEWIDLFKRYDVQPKEIVMKKMSNAGEAAHRKGKSYLIRS